MGAVLCVVSLHSLRFGRIDLDEKQPFLMRMRDLVEQSGLPKTTIHYYLKAELLPRPENSTKNSAIYTDAHLARLEILQRLRSPELGALPLPAIRRVLELIDQGVEPEVAIVLQRSVVGNLTETDTRGPFTLAELAEFSGADFALLREAVAAGILVAAPGDSDRAFDVLDLRIATLLASVAVPFGLTMAELAPIGESIRRASAVEMAMRNRATRDSDPNTAAHISTRFQEGVNFLHTYLFLRARQHDIAEHGLGTSEDRRNSPNEERHSHD